MHRMLPFTPIPRTAIENRSPAEKPVQIKNRITAAFLNFVKADPSSTKNGKRERRQESKRVCCQCDSEMCS